MNKSSINGLFVGAVFFLASSMTYAQDRVVKLTYGAWMPPPLQECGPLRVLKSIEEASNGQLRFEPSDIKSAPGKAYKQVIGGEVDVVWDAAPFSPEQFPLTNLVSLPFTANDHVAASRALHSLASDNLAEEFSGLRLIALHTNGPYQFHMRTPIETLEDLLGRSIRVPGPTMAAAVEALGGVPVRMSPIEAQEKLANDEIDGIAIEWSVPWLLDVTNHHLGLDMMVTPFFLAMNEEAYLKLPKSLQQLIDAHSTPESAAEVAACFAGERVDQTIEAAKAAGHGVVILDDADRAAAARQLASVAESRLDELEGDGLAARMFYTSLKKAVTDEEAKR